MNLSLLEKEYGNVTCNCSINSFKRRVYPAAYLLIFFLGIAFGGVSLCSFFSIFRAKRHFTSVNLYMFNLLVSDLMLLCSLPVRASYYLMDSGWVFGDITCRLVSFVFYINMYGSIYFFVVLSVMRYLAVMHPYRYIELQKGRAAWVVCLIIWLVVSLASLPLLGAGSTKDNMGQTKCLELVRKNIDTIVAMNNATLFFGFVLPVAVVTFCYIYIVCDLLKPKDIGGKRRPSHRMSCALVVIVFTIFLICFLPYHVVRILFLESEKRVSVSGCASSCNYINGVRKAAVVTLCLAVSNSCFNPILFFFAGENFWKFCLRKRKDTWKSKAENRNMGKIPNPELLELERPKQGDVHRE